MKLTSPGQTAKKRKENRDKILEAFESIPESILSINLACGLLKPTEADEKFRETLKVDEILSEWNNYISTLKERVTQMRDRLWSEVAYHSAEAHRLGTQTNTKLDTFGNRIVALGPAIIDAMKTEFGNEFRKMERAIQANEVGARAQTLLLYGFEELEQANSQTGGLDAHRFGNVEANYNSYAFVPNGIQGEPSPAQIEPCAIITELELLGLLRVPPSSALEDLDFTLQQSNRFPESLLRQVWWLTNMDEFVSWYHGPESSLLIADGYLDTVPSEMITLISIFAASFILNLVRNPTRIVLYFFAGLYNGDDAHENPDISGLCGLARNLIAQLLSHEGLPEPDLSFLTYEWIDACRDDDLKALGELFKQLILQVPRGIQVFCIVDGLVIYEDHHTWGRQIDYVAALFQNMAINTGFHDTPVFKALFTYANRSLQISDRVDRFPDIWGHAALATHQMDAAADANLYHRVLQIIHETGQFIDDLTAKYFQGPHHYLPVVSRSRFQSNLISLGAVPSAGFSILLLTICLTASSASKPKSSAYHLSPTHTKNRALYLAAKAFLSRVQSSNPTCISLIQSRLLLALYDYTHGRPEDAFEAIAGCARMAYRARLHLNCRPIVSVETLPDPDAQLRAEGANTWWGIVICERTFFCEIRFQEQPLITVIPSDAILPSGTAEENRNDYCIPSLFISANTNIKGNANGFDRSVQAACLLDRVFKSFEMSDLDSKLVELQDLDIDIQSFLTELMRQCYSRDETSEYCQSIAITIRTLLKLHSHIIEKLDRGIYFRDQMLQNRYQKSQAALDTVTQMPQALATPQPILAPAPTPFDTLPNWLRAVIDSIGIDASTCRNHGDPGYSRQLPVLPPDYRCLGYDPDRVNSTINIQDQSAFFARLPLEVRELIYICLLGNRRIHVNYDFHPRRRRWRWWYRVCDDPQYCPDKSDPFVCPEYAGAEEAMLELGSSAWVRPGFEYKFYALGWLVCCWRAYQESLLLLYQSNCFVLTHGIDQLFRFCRIITPVPPHIDHVHEHRDRYLSRV
ncbi:fungal specific transcription factor domain-containing protein [Aspergillus affinis]|uniref:fungal specific transcription factor domain-containing protein n=1 Tax=Aspergillus affinis TaxID=1070780 RepID=UPI0022FF3267|nr:uncharacterized protein KD926_011280 [Aspergillus affinis]KAI9038145.1 hypothetical protein KD926_011280 [Aspergillus affinis]